MAKDYLTEKAVFTCSLGLGPVIIKCREPANSKAFYNGQKLLTKAAVLKSKAGICQPLTQAAQGVPQPCQCQFTAWNIFFDKELACNSLLLNKNSYNMCAKCGGKISVLQTGVEGHVVKSETPAPVTIPKAIIKTVALLARNMKAARPETAITGDSKIASTENPVTPPDKPDFSNRLCPGCEKYRTCSYYNADTNIDNDSAKLRANYELLSDIEKDVYYERIIKQYGAAGLAPWSYAAHHIISGNQVLKDEEFIELIRMANSLWDTSNPESRIYDINNAKNCAFLISKDYEYGEKNQNKKTVSAYDAMSESGIQWHLGGHSYQFDRDEVDFLRGRVQFLTHQSKGVDLKNYAELLKEELRKIKTSMFTNKVCRETTAQKRAFVQRMNNVSRNVKNKLSAFQEKPHHSFPYYVSKVAYQFAFGLPRTAKIIFVYKEGNKVGLEKFRVTRFNDTITENSKTLDFRQINPVDCSNPSLFALETDADKAAMIKFCENIEFFLLDEGIKIDVLPFCVEQRFILVSEKWEKYPTTIERLKNHDTEILVWLKSCQNFYQYTAPVKRIKERLKECNL